MDQEDLEYRQIREVFARRGMDGGKLPSIQVRQKVGSPQSALRAASSPRWGAMVRRFWVAMAAGAFLIASAIVTVATNLNGRWW